MFYSKDSHLTLKDATLLQKKLIWLILDVRIGEILI